MNNFLEKENIMKTLNFCTVTSIIKLILVCLFILTLTAFSKGETRSDPVSAEILKKLDSPIIHRSVRLTLNNTNCYFGRIKEQTEDSLKLKFDNGDSMMICKSDLLKVERAQSGSGTRYRRIRRTYITFISN